MVLRFGWRVRGDDTVTPQGLQSALDPVKGFDFGPEAEPVREQQVDRRWCVQCGKYLFRCQCRDSIVAADLAGDR